MPLDLDAIADVIAMAVKDATSALSERLAVAESKIADAVGLQQKCWELQARVDVAEAQIKMQPAPVTPPPVDLSPLSDRLDALEKKSFGVSLESLSLIGLPVQVEQLQKRLDAVELRQPVPGPAGPSGKDGKDGADGIGFDDLMVEQTDDRTLVVKAARGERVKAIGSIRVPAMIQRGVWIEGKSYEQGDVCTWAGSQWHANESTSDRPGEGSKAWTLVVKRGRDGKDGKDAPGPLPVVSVGTGR